MNNCKNCFKTNLEFIPNFIHECVETNEDSTHDVWECKDCGAIHYKEGEYDVYEFSPVFQAIYSTIKGFVTDYDVALDKKLKEKELL